MKYLRVLHCTGSRECLKVTNEFCSEIALRRTTFFHNDVIKTMPARIRKVLLTRWNVDEFPQTGPDYTHARQSGFGN